MKCHRVLLLFLSVVLYISSIAQHNAHWVFPYGFHFDFSKGGLRIDTNFTNIGRGMSKTNDFYNYTFSNRQQELLFYAHTFDTIYNSSHIIISNTDSLQNGQDNENNSTLIIPGKNDTDFSFITCRDVSHSNVVETKILKYDFKWLNQSYSCLNKNNPKVLLQHTDTNVSHASFGRFRHFTLSPDSIVFLSYNQTSLFLFLLAKDSFTILDSIVFNTNNQFTLYNLQYSLSNSGNKFLLSLTDTSNNCYLFEGIISELKFVNLKLRSKNLKFPFTGAKIKWYSEMAFDYSDSFYYLIPNIYQLVPPNFYNYLFMIRFGDTPITLNNYIQLPSRTFNCFMRLAYDNKYYLFVSDYKKNVSVLSLTNNKLKVEFNRIYDTTLAQYSEVLSPLVNFIAEPYLFLNYKINSNCRLLTVYNNSSIRFRSHKLFLAALNDTFDFTDSISLYIPPGANQSYYKIIGYSSTGVIKWIEDTLKFNKLDARFKAIKDTICQYSSIDFIDSSEADTVGVLGYSYKYEFGDGQTTVIKNTKSKITNVSHNYLQSGTFFPKLIFENGICSDTFIYSKGIVVMPSTKPGFILNSHIGCVPFSLRISDSLNKNISLKEYDFGSGFVTLKNSSNLDTTILLTLPGTYIIKQRLLLASGCISFFSDTIRIRNGISKNDTVAVYYTTVINNSSTRTTWRPLKYAMKYVINSKETNDTFYVDEPSHPNNQSIKYKIYGVDSCGNTSTTSDVAQTIFLKGDNSNLNEFALLQYTPYETWKNGVLEYQIEVQDPKTKVWLSHGKVDGNVLATKVDVIPDSANVMVNTSQICYRIIAIEKGGNEKLSISNEACVPVSPIVFLPNAFSPNNDGLNDYYKPNCIGLNAYIFEIYNRWGELVYYDTPESMGWDGMFRGEKAEVGIYLFRLSATSFVKSPFTNDARIIERKGTIFLIR